MSAERKPWDGMTPQQCEDKARAFEDAKDYAQAALWWRYALRKEPQAMAEQTWLTDAELVALRGHTPGPWKAVRNRWAEIDVRAPAVERETGLDYMVVNNVNGDSTSAPTYGTPYANALLISAAPAMDLALQLISEGIARIERVGTLREFCFDGIRYVMNGDWNALIDVIGWDRARAAIEKATGGAA